MHIPKIAVTIIPIKIDPGTRAAIKMTVRIKPKRVNQTSGLPNEPRPTRDDELLTISLPFCKPMNAMNNPIPAEIAYLMSCGIASTTFSRNFKIVIKINRNEATRTLAKAVCQLMCIPITTL